MKGFRIDLKTILSLAMPNQCSNYQKVNIKLVIGVIISGQNPQTFMIPIIQYSSTVYRDYGG